VIGVEEGSPTETFGVVSDVEARSDGVYLLDGHAARLYKFSHQGRLITQAGGPGSGPGEFRRPAALATFGDRVAVLDRNKPGLVIFTDRDSALIYEREVRFSFAPRDVCALGDTLIVTGLHDDHAVHVLGPDGAIIRSLVRVPAQIDPKVGERWQGNLRSIVADGVLDCLDDQHMIIVLSEWRPEIRGLRADGSELWRFDIEPYSPFSWTLGADGKSLGFGPAVEGGAVNQGSNVLSIGPEELLFQLKEIRQGRDPKSDPVETYVLNTATGTRQRRSGDMPAFFGSIL
jgi:hypothetical protein